MWLQKWQRHNNAREKKRVQSRREIDEKQNQRNRHLCVQCAVYLVTKYRYVIVVIKNEKPKIAKRDIHCKKKKETSKCVIKLCFLSFRKCTCARRTCMRQPIHHLALLRLTNRTQWIIFAHICAYSMDAAYSIAIFPFSEIQMGAEAIHIFFFYFLFRALSIINT